MRRGVHSGADRITGGWTRGAGHRDFGILDISRSESTGRLRRGKVNRQDQRHTASTAKVQGGEDCLKLATEVGITYLFRSRFFHERSTGYSVTVILCQWDWGGERRQGGVTHP